MNVITNDSYPLSISRGQAAALQSVEYALTSSIGRGHSFPWRMRTGLSERPALTAATILVCVLALWSSSNGLRGLSLGSDTDFWQPSPISIGSPNPAPAPQNGLSAVSLSNGTEIKNRLRLEGHGELTLKNGTSFDAIVNVVEPRGRSVVRSFYVQAGKTFVEKNIAPGIYQVYFSTGKDWDSRTRSFQDDALYGRFERQIDFYETENPLTRNMEFRGYSVTLQYVEGGDEACLPVDKQTFQQMMMDQPPTTARLE
jgi:hypothetical protein